MNKGITTVRFIIASSIIFFVIIGLVNFYGGYIKDAITKNSCSLINESYEQGDKAGEGKCIVPAGIFE